MKFKKRKQQFYDNEYLKILKTIDSCKTIEQLELCKKWISEIDFIKFFSNSPNDLNTIQLYRNQNYAKHAQCLLLDIIDHKIIQNFDNTYKAIGYV